MLSGRRTPLDTFAVAVAVAVSLMFVCVLLASGLLALEREENTFARLARGLVPGGWLLAEKVILAAACSFAVTLAMLLGVSLFVPLDMGRFGLWLLALGGGAIAFATLGVAIGCLAREVRAASLLAFGLALPLAFLALVPSGGVSPALYDVIRVISAVFPFKPALGGDGRGDQRLLAGDRPGARPPRRARRGVRRRGVGRAAALRLNLQSHRKEV